ncbi:sigma factor-like helix-turn-helix DNA-binding protein [Glutamicibacter arilaitensis]|uniref:Uncharacterized protein n=1 Tax=Glutamicibacter arilaitensis TaxID=256701 RepID=A0A4Y8TTG0_9MICC|nr:hypothetical protein EXY26_15360 [Glutamicibacter arilaitensis]
MKDCLHGLQEYTKADERSAEQRLRAKTARVLRPGAAGKLRAREKKQLYLRYFEQHSQQRTGEGMRVSPVQVSRALARLLMRLQYLVLAPLPIAAHKDLRSWGMRVP